MVTTTNEPKLGGEIGAFRIVAYVEAVTYLVLLCAVFVYRALDGPNLVRAMGPIHGIAFIGYFILVLRIRAGQGWGLGRTLLILFVSALPFGGFWAGRHLNEPAAAA